jgi:hypothetical protein
MCSEFWVRSDWLHPFANHGSDQCADQGADQFANCSAYCCSHTSTNLEAVRSADDCCSHNITNFTAVRSANDVYAHSSTYNCTLRFALCCTHKHTYTNTHLCTNLPMYMPARA